MPNWLVKDSLPRDPDRQFLCGLATVTSASRMIFAFSRDGGLPVSPMALSKVSPKYRTPVAAIWTGAVLAVLFVWWRSSSRSAGPPSIRSSSRTVIFLFLSFTVPIALGFFAIGTAKWAKMGPWDIGMPLFGCSPCCRCSAWSLIFFIGVQPPNDRAL